MRHIAASSYQSVPWKNGSGMLEIIASSETFETEGDRWNNLDWQISTTPLVDGTKFSYLENYDRWQMVIEGEGLYLDTPSGVVDLSQPYETVFYQGELPIVTRLTNGGVRVFNLMTRRGKFGGKMEFVKAGTHLSLRNGIHIIYALEDCSIGRHIADDVKFLKHDSIQLQTGELSDVIMKLGSAVICSLYSMAHINDVF